MNNGDEVRVRRSPGDNPWVEAKVDLISRNQESLGLSAAEGLGTPEGFGVNTETGRQQLILMKAFSELGPSRTFYRDIFSEILWEVVEK